MTNPVRRSPGLAALLSVTLVAAWIGGSCRNDSNAALCGPSFFEDPGNPDGSKSIPLRFDPRDPITVPFVEFASLPDSDGRPARMMFLVDEPGTRRLFVNDMRGPLYSIGYDGRNVAEYLDLGNQRWDLDLISSRVRGFQSFAFHPQFNIPGTPGYGKFFTVSDTSNTAPASDFGPRETGAPDMVLLEWSARDPALDRYDGEAPREMLRASGYLNITLAFSPLPRPGDSDYGNLYLAVSDPYLASQELDSIFGKILRIAPFGSDGLNGEFGIPPDNPFAGDGDPGTLGEIYAYGMRVPQRIAWDAGTGNMLVADIGADYVEEISLVEPGADLGWREWEGSYRTIPRKGAPPLISFDDPRSDPAVTWPVVEFGHEEEFLIPGSVGITGIIVYRDDAIPELRDLVLFGDIPSGELLHVPADCLTLGDGRIPIRRVLLDDGGEARTLGEVMQERNRVRGGGGMRRRVDLRLGTGPDGMVFLLNKRDGVIRLLTRGPVAD